LSPKEEIHAMCLSQDKDLTMDIQLRVCMSVCLFAYLPVCVSVCLLFISLL
jgi:hypothetical protein